ncbi:agamous-like MADS-box protein AGL80 [Triticum aestivum]|uniref:agamous-like MADS-box protein AGL80 n=1 Tax=Triticum aestivum TaxID=4565 RepID=UPI001D028AC1|nr:agamous-like MADS-box protein AGL80 [Triticum aestivum]
MAPKKVNMEYIAHGSPRKATFKKRGIGMKKKARELSTLCGVDVCYVMYYPEGESSQVPEVYPSVPEAMRVIDRFRSTPELDRCKKKIGGEDYIRERISKLQEQLSKARCDSHRLETKVLLHDVLVGHRQSLAGLNIEQLASLGWMADNYMKKVSDCIASNKSRRHADPLHCAAIGADVNAEGPPLQGWATEVVKPGPDVDSAAYGGNADGDVTQISNLAVGFAWADRGHFLDIEANGRYSFDHYPEQQAYPPADSREP